MNYHEQIAEKRGYHEQQIMGAAIGPGVNRVESGLVRELQHMEKNLGALVCNVDMLQNRLSMVSIPQPEATAGLRNAPSAGSSLTMQLAAFNTILSDQLTRLGSLTQGLDL
jgi:hypothetical protein